jgi:hypothetical protein
MSGHPVDQVLFTDHYEALRAWVTGQAEAVTRPAGLVLVLQQGVPGWLASWSMWLRLADRVHSPGPSDTVSMASASSLAMVLAAMVEQCQRETPP